MLCSCEKALKKKGSKETKGNKRDKISQMLNVKASSQSSSQTEV